MEESKRTREGRKEKEGLILSENKVLDVHNNSKYALESKVQRIS